MIKSKVVSNQGATMPVATFDTLKFSKALREAGVSEKQAEAQAAVLSEAFSFNFKDVTTKDDLKAQDERRDYKFKDLEQRLTAKFEQLKSEFVLVKWMLGVVIALVGSVAVRTFLFPAK
jgi:hypothetical protein